jgi:antitoxin (DNA-binding transcriptional repressor) of toxin-antitoxin stability system
MIAPEEHVDVAEAAGQLCALIEAAQRGRRIVIDIDGVPAARVVVVGLEADAYVDAKAERLFGPAKEPFDESTN